jgi:hypothetical protein
MKMSIKVTQIIIIIKIIIKLYYSVDIATRLPGAGIESQKRQEIFFLYKVQTSFGAKRPEREADLVPQIRMREAIST